jgi:hypothetical protein
MAKNLFHDVYYNSAENTEQERAVDGTFNVNSNPFSKPLSANFFPITVSD